MCGIVGIAHVDPLDQLSALNHSLAHRGPDGSGEYRDPANNVALAMRRLSILDVDGGQQPMSNEDGTIWIVYNGEIYNSPELRTQLVARGHRFKTSHSDTECLIHLYEDKGEDMLACLNGMFAFVIYDQRRGRLFGARDRFGIKPLYYTRASGGLVIASELKSLLLAPGVSRNIDLDSLYQYLSLRYVPGEGSIFTDIHRIPPAHYFVYDCNRRFFDVHRYWQPDFGQQEQHSETQWAEIILEEFRRAVGRWVLSDVPVACSLSGGLDSTSIVGVMAEMGYPRLQTYSVGFGKAEEASWNELALARKVAEKWGTDHHELILDPEMLLDDLIGMVWSLDEPYGGGLPSWYVYRFMSRSVKVGLTGTGADELFGGYGKWVQYEQSQRGSPSNSIGVRVTQTARNVAQHLPGWLIGAKRKTHYRGMHRSYAHPMEAYGLYFDDAIKKSGVIAFERDARTDTIHWLQRQYDASAVQDVRNAFASVDMQNQLSEEFLLMTDRFSMAHSLEARVPFLDHVFAERMFKIPPKVRMQPGNLKSLFRKAVAHLLPPELLKAPKRGFVLPDTIWLRGKLRPLVKRLLSPDRLKAQGLFQPSVYNDFVAPHLDAKADLSGQVWTLLMFQLWHTVFIEESASSKPSFTWQDLL